MNVERLLINESNIKKVQSLLSKYNLVFDNNIDFLVCIRDKGQVVATGAKDKNLFKMVAFNPEYKGQGLASKIIQALKDKCFEEGLNSTYLITQTKFSEMFEGLGYKVLTTTSGFTLLEEGFDSFEKWIETIKVKPNSAMLVMNCNPMTIGHLQLIQKACKENEDVVLFIVQEDSSEIPFETRFKIVKENTKDIKNLTVYKSGKYIISNITFPTYFERKAGDINKLWAEIDISMINIIANKLGIIKRIVGTEPNSESTNQYNEVMKNNLTKDFKLEIVERFKIDNQPISASMLRKAIINKDWKLAEKIAAPKTLGVLEDDGIIRR